MSDDLPLGRSVPYPEAYAPEVLRGIPRSRGRDALGLAAGPLPFAGEDVWNAYELSWLARSGQPRVGTAVLRVPCTSARVVESKSLKLYLMSLCGERLGEADDVISLLVRDLPGVLGDEVEVAVQEGVVGPSFRDAGSQPEVISLDALDIPVEHAPLDADLLAGPEREPDPARVCEVLETHAFRSLCPVTGQPDWASVRIDYAGRAIDRARLLHYLVSYRAHREFHECCVERIFCDLWRVCELERLSVEARFTRRGGIDINPFRTSAGGRAPNFRTGRQ